MEVSLICRMHSKQEKMKGMTLKRPIDLYYQEETVSEPSVYGNYTEICSYVAKETLLSTRVL